MKLLFGILGLTLSSAIALATANAADIYQPGGYKDGPYILMATWTGFYAGVNGGYAWSAGDPTVSSAVSDIDPTAKLSPTGGFGGGQIGYNWQRDRFVFGIETDIQGAGIGETAIATASASGFAAAKSSLDWFGTVRGRLGYAFGSGLIYATGGFAYGGVADRLLVTAVSGGVSSTTSVRVDNTATGYVVGGGLEYALNPAWSLKAEYQYIDLGGSALAGTASEGPIVSTGSANFVHSYNTVRLGLNYHVHQDYIPLK
jgi:outer membrane immunogenic protein